MTKQKPSKNESSASASSDRVDLPGNVYLFYPVYVNTFALKVAIEQKFANVKTRAFDWAGIVPSELRALFEIPEKDGRPDLVMIFSSSEKQDDLTRTVKKILDDNKLTDDYGVSMEKAELTEERNCFDFHFDYSNFLIKYLFFPQKENIQKIHDFGKLIYDADNHGNPFLSRLISLLLSRGYKTLYIDTELKDESKGLLRKLLHEEYGFRFHLVPRLAETKDNNVLPLTVKGGQQSYEELKLQQARKKGTDGIPQFCTFVVPEKLKFTSKTRLVFVYRKAFLTQEDNCEKLLDLGRYLESVRHDFFDPQTEILKFYLDDKVSDNFIGDNIDFVVDELRREKLLKDLHATNPFLRSLRNYPLVLRGFNAKLKAYSKSRLPEQKESLIEFLRAQTQLFQMPEAKDFISCLRDHHVSEDSPKGPIIKNSFRDNWPKFCKRLVDLYPDFPLKKNILFNGLFLIDTILQHPNGLSNQDGSDIAKFKEQIGTSDSISTEDFLEIYHLIRILAEDINHLVVEENLMGEPSQILKKFVGFDLTEFEYLYSIDFSQEHLSAFYSQSTEPNSKS